MHVHFARLMCAHTFNLGAWFASALCALDVHAHTSCAWCARAHGCARPHSVRLMDTRTHSEYVVCSHIFSAPELHANLTRLVCTRVLCALEEYVYSMRLNDHTHDVHLMYTCIL